MKKLASSLICLLLLLALCPLASAVENANVVFDSTAEIIVSVAAVHGSAYALVFSDGESDLTLMQWKSGMEAAQALSVEGLTRNGCDELGNPAVATDVSHLFAGDDELYAYDEYNKSVRKLVDAQGNLTSTAILYFLEEGETFDEENIENLFVQDGQLYLIKRSDASEWMISVYDVQTGAQQSQRKEKNIEGVYPYKDGKLLALRFEGIMDEATGKWLPYELMIYDPTNGEMEKIGDTKDVDDSGVLYSKSTNNIYFASGSKVYSFQDMQAPYQLSAYLPITLWGDEICILLNEELYGCVHQNVLVLRALDQPELTQGALNILGDIESAAHTSFITNHPEMAITTSYNQYSTVAELATAIINGEKDMDIIILSSADYPIEQIIDKGYVADLSDYPQIVESVFQMNPAITSYLMRDGKLYGIPMRAEGYGLGIVTATANEIGIKQEDYPSTYLEFLDFLANFQADYGEEHPEVTLFGNFNFKELVFTNMLSRYTNELLRNGDELSFDTPLFRKLITAFEAIDFEPLDPYEQYGEGIWNENAALNDFNNKRTLLWNDTAYQDPYQFRESNSTWPLLLPLDEGMEPLADLQVLAFFVSARTEHMDQAILYLSEYIRAFNAYTSFTFFPSMNQPVLNPDYDGLVKEYERYIAQLETRIETADEEKKAELKNRLAGAQAGLAEKDQWKWLIIAEDIAKFNALASPYFYVPPMTPLSNWSEGQASEFDSISQQYLQKSIDSEGFIHEMGKRMHMMLLEEQ